MMFYGDVRKKNRPLADFRSDLLRHFIVALQVLQKEGNLLLKLEGTMDCFSASVLMVL